jgi:glutamate-1-semialdehyde 2,1-aminomutase
VTSVAANSERVYADASRVVSGGTHSNSRLRAPYPLYIERAEGAHLRGLTERLQAGLTELGERHGVAVVPAAGGGHFQPYFTRGPVVDYRSALATNPLHYAAFVQVCARRNILVAEKALLHSALSAAHTDDDIDELLAAADEAFAEIARSR